jgi:hypothetical protein
MLHQAESVLPAGTCGSHRSGAARLKALSQPDAHHLSSLVAKMILVTYKSDVHPLAAEAVRRGWPPRPVFIADRVT